MANYPAIKSKSALFKPVSASGVAGIKDRHIILLGNPVNGIEEREEVLLGVDVLLPVSREKNVFFRLKA